ncbi:MAG: hypothetical protein K1X38_07080 [Microthrixaceae bacterium]|nr:hypothetical protein [Microthrixaceae bacterium]
MSTGVMRRLRAPVLAAVWAAAVGSVAVGGGGTMAAALLATATAVTAAALATRQRGRGRGGTESRWSAPGEPRAAVPVTAVPPTGAPVVGAPTIGASDRRSRRAVARSIGRFEARELAINPWFGAGVGICVLGLIAFASIADPEPTDLADAAAMTPFLAHPLVGLTIVAAHRNATRSQRDNTTELVEACPADNGVRTAGFLRAGWVPVVALGAFFAAYLVIVAATGPRAGGSGGAVAMAAAHIVSGLLLGAGGVALGIALARWARHSLVPIVAVVAVGFVSLRLGDGAPGEYRPRMLLSTFGPLSDEVVLTTTQAWVHVAWLAAISAATATAAMVARERA